MYHCKYCRFEEENTGVLSSNTTLAVTTTAVSGAAVTAGSDGASAGRTEAAPQAAANAPVVIYARDTEYAAILGDIEIPEGVDPSFLAALPEDMRQEVIAEHLR